MKDSYNQFSVAVISSFAPDEPIKEIVEAARDLHNVRFYITGDCSRAREIDKRILNLNQDNVILTGFLDRNDYISLLHGADIVMVLTKRDKTMLAGAYEALAIKKPLVTSNWLPLKRYFYKGAIFVDNSPAEIREAVKTAQENIGELVKEICELKLEKTDEWKKKFVNFQSKLLSYALEKRSLSLISS